MTVIADIRAALAQRIIDGVEFPFTQVSPYVLSNPTPPCAYVLLAEQDWPEGAGKTIVETLTFNIHVLISLNADVAAQQVLDPLVDSSGAQSMKQALETPDAGENTVTLGGLISDLQVTRCRPDRLLPIKGRPDPHASALGAEWTLYVYP